MDDFNPDPPVARGPDPAGGGGSGRHMVPRLAGRVEIGPLPGGQHVRASRRRPAAP